MKKIVIIGLILIIGITTILCIPKKENNLKELKLAEVTHSIFYAPLYVAIENKYFEEENIKIDLTLVSGADKVSAAVLSNDIDIGFAGPESTIYVYNGGEEDYLVNFAGLTKRDGQFIVGRNKETLDLNNLKGKEVLVGRKGGMPSLNFLNALDNENVNKDDININYSVDFSALSGTFISKVGDYVNLFEPNATKLEQQGLGYIVASIGKYSGEMPYTAFFARKSFINNNPSLIKGFRNAINKGLKYVKEHDEDAIAKTIINQFSDTTVEELKIIIKRYKENDTWLNNTYISEESFKNLEKVMIKANLLDNYVDYSKLINNE
ncbi:MAG: ABC transporter substrate-binding protein [Bacilli bacterium]|nr:ABC transporter substrate-binding protein [Bacilli bacterium]